MKKLFLVAAMTAMTSMAASAQTRLQLNTYKGTDLEKFDGQVCQVSAYRYVFNGWNTLTLPFDMSEEQLCQAFGQGCRLERLVSADDTAQGAVLFFMDCRQEGLKANTPYMLYFDGEAANIRLEAEALVTNEPSAITVVTPAGERITMTGTLTRNEGEGLYGVLARDNQEVKFVNTSGMNTNGFYATRCFITMASGTSKVLTAQHLGYGETTNINAIAAQDELVDVYSASGQKVASQMRAADVNNLRPAVYIVKGRKVLVK